MGKYANYDTKERVVLVDLSGLTMTDEIGAALERELLSLAQSLPHKVFAVVCWQDTWLDPAQNQGYGPALAELLSHFRGIVRYGVSNLGTRTAIRAATVKGHLQGTQSHI